MFWHAFEKEDMFFSCWDFEGCLFFPFTIKITYFVFCRSEKIIQVWNKMRAIKR